MKKKSFFTINLFILILIALFLYPAIGYSQTRTDIRGEVMNVNQHLRVAFIDIGQRYLSKGDVIEVQASHDKRVYMQILETSGVISKIGFGRVVERNFDARPSDFKRIRIGNLVGKMEFYDSGKDAIRTPLKATYSVETKNRHDEEASEELLREFEELTKTSQEISRQLDLSMEEIERLKSEGGVPKKEHDDTLAEKEICLNDKMACTERVNHLEDKIRILTQKLKYMQELIEKSTFPAK